MNRAAALLIGLVFVGAGGTPALAAQDCGAIANLKIENTNLLSATEVPAAGGARFRATGNQFRDQDAAPRVEREVLHGRVRRLLRHPRRRPARVHQCHELWAPAQLRRLYDGLRSLGDERPGWPMGDE